MPDIPRRQGDAASEDHRDERRFDPGAWGLRIGYGRWGVDIRGFAVIFLLALFGLVGANFWAGWRIEQAIERQVSALHQASKREHVAMMTALDRSTCILALTNEERLAFRRDTSPGAITRWCWWLQEQTP